MIKLRGADTDLLIHLSASHISPVLKAGMLQLLPEAAGVCVLESRIRLGIGLRLLLSLVDLLLLNERRVEVGVWYGVLGKTIGHILVCGAPRGEGKVFSWGLAEYRLGKGARTGCRREYWAVSGGSVRQGTGDRRVAEDCGGGSEGGRPLPLAGLLWRSLYIM